MSVSNKLRKPNKISFCEIYLNELELKTFVRTIFMITVNGTENNIPPIPQIDPQKNKLSKITTGDTSNLFPANLGSIIFPKTIWVIINKNNKTSNPTPKPEFTKWDNPTIPTAKIEPIFGIKF